MIYYAADSMRALYQMTEYAPKRWLKNELTESESKILGHRENIRQWLIEKKCAFSMRKKLEKELTRVLIGEFYQMGPPTLKAPVFFSRNLSSDLKSFLSDLLSGQPVFFKAKDLIKRAELTLQTPEFYTLPDKNGFIIRGNSTSTYGSLLCFAHELGHALYELDNLGDEIGSEVAAFLFEDQVAEALLAEEGDRAEWVEYKRAQDQLNYFLCLNEFAEFDTGISKIPKNYLFFRESLVTCWGYQTINAWASLQRALFLHAPRP